MDAASNEKAIKNMSVSEVGPADHIHPFPDPDNVFASNVELHRKHLVPLVSIDATHFDTSWTGKLHFVYPKENYDGLVGEYCYNGMVGEYCPEFNNEWCKEDLLAFKVDDNGKYSFLADFRYFLTERGALDDSPGYIPALIEDLTEQYDDVEAELVRTRNFYNTNGYLNAQPSPRPRRKTPWFSTSGSPSFNNKEIPVLPNGREPHFVAQTSAHNYLYTCFASLILYFEPVDRIAIIQLDDD